MKLIKLLITSCIVFVAWPSFGKQFQIEQWQTPNGVKVVFYRAMEVPMLDVSLAFAAGSAYDDKQFGLSHLTTLLMNQGNAGKDATAIAESLDEYGAQYNAEVNRDMAIFNLRTLTSQEALNQAVKTFATIIQHPDFPEEALQRGKMQTEMSIKQMQESADETANVQFFNALYQQHPYAHSSRGTIESIKTIQKKQLIDFYKRYFVAQNAVIVLVGAIDKSQAERIALEITKDLPKGEAAPSLPKASVINKPEQIQVKFPSSQTVVRLGTIGIDHQNPDYFPLIVGNYILGGGPLVSRLAIEVREKQGLTYNINSQIVPMPGMGPFLIGFSTRHNQSAKALDITQKTLDEFIQNGPSPQELSDAKQYLAGNFALSLASNKQIANILLRMRFYNLPENYLDTYVTRIQAVTQNDIKHAIQRLLNPKHMILTTVGPS